MADNHHLPDLPVYIRALSIGQDLPRLCVGSLVIAKRDTRVCRVGEPGVCYEVYQLDGRPGWSFLFEQGGHDGSA